MAVRDIVLAPNGILRTVATPISFGMIAHEDLRNQLIEDLGDSFDAVKHKCDDNCLWLIDEMDAPCRYEGKPGLVGLAANQIGHPYQAMVVDAGDEGTKRWYMFNPKIIRRSTIEVGKTESCASLPGIEVYVVRPSTVMVAYDDPFTKKHKVHTFMNYEARIVQHECDHLNGILLTDYEELPKSERKK